MKQNVDRNQVIGLAGDCLLRDADLVAMGIYVSEGAARIARHRGQCPLPVFRVGRAVRYKLSDVRKFLSSQGAPLQ